MDYVLGLKVDSSGEPEVRGELRVYPGPLDPLRRGGLVPGAPPYLGDFNMLGSARGSSVNFTGAGPPHRLARLVKGPNAPITASP